MDDQILISSPSEIRQIFMMLTEWLVRLFIEKHFDQSHLKNNNAEHLNEENGIGDEEIGNMPIRPENLELKQHFPVFFDTLSASSRDLKYLLLAEVDSDTKFGTFRSVKAAVKRNGWVRNIENSTWKVDLYTSGRKK